MEQNVQNAAEQNIQARNILVATGRNSTLEMGSYDANLGDSVQMRLKNYGILKKVVLKFEVDFTVATAAATMSPYGWLNLIRRIQVRDFTGTVRHSCSARFLWLAETIRKSSMEGLVYPQYAGIGSSVGLQSSGFVAPDYALTVGDHVATFYVDVPICVDPAMNDLRGAMLLQSTQGEAFVYVDIANTIKGTNDDTVVFNGAPTSAITVNGITVEGMQEYIYPSAMSASNLPFLDLSTNYEISSTTLTDGFAAGLRKEIALRNNIQISRAIGIYFHNGYQGGSGSSNGISRYEYLLGGTNPVLNRQKGFQEWYQRQWLNGIDVGKGNFFFDFEGKVGNGERPIRTADLGGLQIGITPESAPSGTTMLEFGGVYTYPTGQMNGAIVPGGN